MLSLGCLRIDASQHGVRRDGKPIRLSAKELKLLECLARQQDNVASPRELLQITPGLDTEDVEARALLRPLVRSVRRKLGYEVGQTGCIETVHSVGYRLITLK